jgi:hypothetical protein
MASIHETSTVDITTTADALAPLFIPLLEITPGTQLIASQCSLTVTGVPSPFEVAIMLCKPGTVQGDPGDAVLQVGEVHAVVAGQPQVLAGSVPPLDQGGVLGLSVPVQPTPTGATIKGTLSTVR